MSFCSVCGNSFPCAGFDLSLNQLVCEISTSYSILHPALGAVAFGTGMSLRSHRDHLFKQKSTELERLEKKLLGLTPEHKFREKTEKQIADLKLELGVQVVEDE
jgi:hypothetical protein